MTFWHPDSRHDDILWAMALAIYGVAQEAGYSWGAKRVKTAAERA